GAGPPRNRRRWRLVCGLAPQHSGGEPNASGSVCQAVMDSPDERHRVVLEPLDHVQVPEWVSPVQGVRHQTSDDLLQPSAAHWLSRLNPSDMALDVEFWI